MTANIGKSCIWTAVEEKFFYRPYFHYYLSNVHNCGDRFHIRFFNRSSHLRFSYIYSHLIKSKIKFKKYGSTWLPYLKESPLSLLKKIPIFLFWWEHKVSQCMLYCFLFQYGFTSLHLAAQNGDNTLVRAITNHPGVRVDTVTGKAVGWMPSFVQMYANEFRVTYKVTSLRFPLKTTPKSRRGEQSPLTNFCILVRSFMYSFNSNPFISFPKLVMFGRFVSETNLIALREGGQLICSRLRLPVYQKYATRQSTCPMLLMTWFKVLLATRFSLLFHLCRVAQHSI